MIEPITYNVLKLITLKMEKVQLNIEPITYNVLKLCFDVSRKTTELFEPITYNVLKHIPLVGSSP